MFALSSFISTMMLIPSCAIGAGLFSFPIITGLSGFMPGALAILLTWIFSTFVGLLIADICCHTHVSQGKDMHFFMLTKQFLPRILQIITLASFLFICYGSLIGYLDGIIISSKAIQTIEYSNKITGIFFMFILAVITYQNNHIVIHITNMLFPIIFMIYFYFSYLAFNDLNTSFLTHVDYSKISMAFPTLVTAFSFQIMIPSMSNALNGNRLHLRWAIIIGTAINCIMYLVWFFIMLGINPIENLRTAFTASITLTASISSKDALLLQIMGNVFALITMFTSFTSISISLKDYWNEIISTPWFSKALSILFKTNTDSDDSNCNNLTSDNCRIVKIKSYIVQTLIYLPIMAIFLSFNRLFLWVFSSTGGYGDAIAFGLMPIYMSYIAIKHHNMERGYPILLYFLAILFFIFVFVVQAHSDLSAFAKLLFKAIESAKLV